MPKKIRQWFSRGSGTAILGVMISMMILICIIVLMIIFVLISRSYDVQAAADSCSDGVAVFMSQNKSATYAEALDKLDEVAANVADVSGIIIDSVSLDEMALKDKEVVVTLVASGQYNMGGSSAGIFAPLSGMYKLTKTATTEYSSYGSGVAYVEWALETADDNTHGYSMENRTGTPDYDCSSFVYYSLINGGYEGLADLCGGPFSTGSMTEPLLEMGFTELDYNPSNLMEGDILWVVDAAGNHHTEIYVSNGQSVGARGDTDGVPGDGLGNEILLADTLWQPWVKVFRPPG